MWSFFSGLARLIESIEAVSDFIGMLEPVGWVVVVACLVLGIGAIIRAFRGK